MSEIKKTVCISGGFDPIHGGHIDYITEAAKLGDVTVILNSDEWLMRKKGYVFMQWPERARVLEAIRGVKKVIGVYDIDNSVSRALEIEKPDIFCNGGDRAQENTPEGEVCSALGITMVFNVGGEKTQSSSRLVQAARSEVL
jgi:D-beta-D-heptose 7-phosphate kinase/D-beta-D-heptose 1-phosphate adenosyltransferase